MTYSRVIPIEFNHCDPAGIVFYPRYFEMTNSVVENFFADVLDRPFHRIFADGNGVPTVRIETDFRAPSRLGDKVVFDLDVEEVGTRSVRFAITAHKDGVVRLTARLTLVWVGTDGRAAPWPDPLRRMLAALVRRPAPSAVRPDIDAVVGNP